MTSWLHETEPEELLLCDLSCNHGNVVDGEPTPLRFAYMTAAVHGRIDRYDGTLPTSPSAGRIYLRRYMDGDWLHWVQDEPGSDGRYQLHHPFKVKVVDADEP